MPYYSVIVKEKGKNGKKYTLPNPVFAPSCSEAFDEAVKIAPKGTTVYDVIPEEEKKKKRYG